MKTYTILPAPTMERLEPVLKEYNIVYRLLFNEDIPEDIPEECVWNGHSVMRHLVCVESEIDPVVLRRFDEDLHNGKNPDPTILM